MKSSDQMKEHQRLNHCCEACVHNTVCSVPKKLPPQLIISIDQCAEFLPEPEDDEETK